MTRLLQKGTFRNYKEEMEDVTCGGKFEPGQPGDDLEHAQEAGGTDGEAPHHPVQVDQGFA